MIVAGTRLSTEASSPWVGAEEMYLKLP